jgi:hypothetical protein
VREHRKVLRRGPEKRQADRGAPELCSIPVMATFKAIRDETEDDKLASGLALVADRGLVDPLPRGPGRPLTVMLQDIGEAGGRSSRARVPAASDAVEIAAAPLLSGAKPIAESKNCTQPL